MTRRRLQAAPWVACPPGLSRRYWALVTRFFPAGRDADLLRAVLTDEAVARPAWERWLAHSPDPVRTLGSDPRNIKVLVPLLAHHLRALGVHLSPAFQTYARANHLTETLRMAGFLRHAASVIDRLQARNIPLVVIKGAALAEHAYADPAFRHAHDFDVLVPEDRVAEGVGVLEAEGFTPLVAVGADYHHAPPLVNTAGFAVELHRRFRLQYPDYTAAGIFDRSVEARVGGHLARIPSRADMLLQACVHGVTCASNRNFRWVADVWTITRRFSEADWNRTRSLAIETGLALPVTLTLGYVDAAIGAVGPVEVLDDLFTASAKTSRFGRSAATYNARMSLPLKPAGILRMPGGWAARLGQLMWRVWPSPRHLQWMHGLPSTWAALPQYPYRFLKALKAIGAAPQPTAAREPWFRAGRQPLSR